MVSPSSAPWLFSSSLWHWPQRWTFFSYRYCSLSILRCMTCPQSPQSPYPCPTSFLFASPAESSSPLRVQFSGDCLTTNTSFVPFHSPGNLGLMQPCGSRKIQVQPEHSLSGADGWAAGRSSSSSVFLWSFTGSESCISPPCVLFAPSFFISQAVNWNGWVVHLATGKGVQLAHPTAWSLFRALCSAADIAINEKPPQVPSCCC